MRPYILSRNVKLQILHADNFKQVTSIPFGDFHPDNTSFSTHCCAKSYFNKCHRLFMLSHTSYSEFLADTDTWDMLCGHRTSMLRKTPSSCRAVLLLLHYREKDVKLNSYKRPLASICVVFHPLQEINEA